MEKPADNTSRIPGTNRDPVTPSRGLHRLGVVAAFSTFFVLIAGASVTSTGSGLSVPDWPLSYGKLFPEMVGGVFFEHGHRMVAGAVALILGVLLVWTWKVEPRGWVRFLATLAFTLVIGQALLGGLTVLMLLPTSVSVAHATTAMLVFATVVTFAAVTSSNWGTTRSPRPQIAGRMAALSTFVWGLLFLQIGVGALVRHNGAGLACPDFPLCHGELIPPLHSFFVAIHFFHRLGGVIVTLAVFMLAAAGHLLVPGEKGLRNLLIGATGLVVLQFALGVASILMRLAPHITVAHHAGGAALLALLTLVTVWSYRLAYQPQAVGQALPMVVAHEVPR